MTYYAWMGKRLIGVTVLRPEPGAAATPLYPGLAKTGLSEYAASGASFQRALGICPASAMALPGKQKYDLPRRIEHSAGGRRLLLRGLSH